MEVLIKGDKIISNLDNKEYVVDCVEILDDVSVVFTDGLPCKCIPINNVTKAPKNALANYFIKLFNGEKLTQVEENELTNKLSKLKPVTILPTDPDFLKPYFK